MSLTNDQVKRLECFITNRDRQQEIVESIEEKLVVAKRSLNLYNSNIKYLQALRDGDLQGQVEAKLGWELFEPIEFLYEGKSIKGVYSGVWGGYDNRHIRLHQTYYSLKQIIEENITNNDTNTDTPT